MNYHPWEQDERNDALAWLKRVPAEIKKKHYLLDEAELCAGWFPRDLAFDVAPGKGVRLADAIPNVMAWLFVSEKLKTLLENESGARFEFLPIRIKDHKGRVAKAPYFIANLLDAVACMDRKRSDFEMDPLDKGQVEHFRRLVLDERKIPPEAKVFRLAEKTDLFIVREDLVRAIRVSGCTGTFFPEMEDYGAEFRD